MKRLFILFLFLPLFVSAQDLESKIQEAEAIVQEYFDEANLPGMAVSIYLGDEMVWSDGFGYANVENQKIGRAHV